MSTPNADWIWLDGEFIPWDQANLHILTHTLHYGLGVFEGTRAYKQEDGGTAVFRLGKHLERLERSGKILQIENTYDRDTMAAATLELIARNNLESCYLRHLVFIDAGVMGLHPKDNRIRTAIIAWPWGAYLGEDGLAKGIRCKVSSYVRHFPNSSMSKAKATGNYINSILAKREVVANGYDEAILLDTDGYVAEGSGENIFMVRDGVLKTPPLTSILEGITRETVIQLARDSDIRVEQVLSTRDELYTSDEIFLTGTAAEITPVREVDDRPVGTGTPGPVTKKLQDLYFGVIEGRRPEYRDWLSPVAFDRAA